MPAYRGRQPAKAPTAYVPKYVVPNAAKYSAPKRPLKSERSYPTLPLGAAFTKGNLVAIDPGITTGYAARIQGKLFSCVCFTPEEVLDLIEGAHTVVYERFATSGRISSYGLETVELVGMITGFCYARKIKTVRATPTMRYTHMNAAALMVGRGKLIEPSKVQQHQIDSLAHLLAFEYRNERY